MDTPAPCEDEYDTGTPGGNPFCTRPAGHEGGHAGADAFGGWWTWRYHAVTYGG
jgi:hypothetical protein